MARLLVAVIAIIPRLALASCAGNYQKCGGVNFPNTACCDSSYTCVASSEWYSGCRPKSELHPSPSPTKRPTTHAPTKKSPTHAPTKAPTRSPSSCAGKLKQCGGSGFGGVIRCCDATNSCVGDHYYKSCNAGTHAPTASPGATKPTPKPAKQHTSPTAAPSAALRGGRCPAPYVGPPQPGFQITLFNPTCNTTYDSYFQAAAAKWESVIVGDLWDLEQDEWLSPELGFGSYSGVVDDVLIAYRWGEIDGEGGLLGNAGPLWMRAESSGRSNAVSGTMTFDSADMDWMAQSDQLLKVITHEMGHVLGIGTLWGENGCSTCRWNGGSGRQTKYKCTAAPAAFYSLGFTGDLRIEDSGGNATRCSHWDENQLNSEVMTGYVEDDGVFMPLSAITVGTLSDMGYTVDYTKADPFSPATGRRLADDDAAAAAGDADAAGTAAPAADAASAGSGGRVRRPRGTSGPGKGKVGEGFYLDGDDLCLDFGLCPRLAKMMAG